MTTVETHYQTFQETCEALGVPPGAGRVDAFLNLPAPTQSVIYHEMVDHLVAVRAEREGDVS